MWHLFSSRYCFDCFLFAKPEGISGLVTTIDPVGAKEKRAAFGGEVTKKFPSDTRGHGGLKFKKMSKSKFLPLAERKAYQCFEDVIGCKWSSSVVAAVAQGVKRPGELERYIPGISTKVLNERLRKLLAFGLLQRTEQSRLPARVDYDLTEAGQKLAAILEQVRALNNQHSPEEK
jgi:DNA-binding HxlR family transcriptional regulator